MTPEQQLAHARMLATHTITEHVKMFDAPRYKKPVSTKLASENGRKGKIAAKSVPMVNRKKR